MKVTATHCFRFDRFEILPAQRQILVAGQAASLGAKAFDLLLCLIEHRERVVGKDELMALVWPGLVVEENNLSVQVSALRKLFGADAITTVAGRGYQFSQPALEIQQLGQHAWCVCGSRWNGGQTSRICEPLLWRWGGPRRK